MDLAVATAMVTVDMADTVTITDIITTDTATNYFLFLLFLNELSIEYTYHSATMHLVQNRMVIMLL